MYSVLGAPLSRHPWRAVIRSRRMRRVVASATTANHPLEARRALAYVLLNARRHWTKRHRTLPPVRLDAASSARWFDGWASTQAPPCTRSCEVAPAQTWLLRVGWRRHGRIALTEVPG